MPALTLLVLDKPNVPYLRLLDRLPDSTRIVVSNRIEGVAEAAPEADIIMCGMGMGKLLRDVWPLTASRLKWLHSYTTGLESVLFPELIESSVTMTNARGVFARSLGEFVVAAALYFAKDFRRMVRSQQAGQWDQFDVEELTGKVMGIVGYGEIGQAAAQRAVALGMKVVAARRRPELSADDPLVERMFPLDKLGDLLAESDYVAVAAALTPESCGMIGELELRRMKPSAVIINVGRGPVIQESALIRALEENWIRGAALDVFDHEPLSEGHAFYRLDNVLLSPHIADHTPGWMDDAMHLFLENFERFAKGEPLRNVVDKHHGY